MMESTPTTPKHRSRWLQFRLRTLLVLMLAFACGFGWLAFKIKRAREQREAVEAIEELGGIVDCEPASGGMIRTAVAWVGKLLGEDLSQYVTGVSLANTHVTDAGLKHVEGFFHLQTLVFCGTQATDAGLEHVRGLTQLDWLDIHSTRITDAGVEQLRGLTQLRYLHLANTQVTDAGLVHLRGLRQLELLCLSNTQVTAAGVADLQKVLPNCEITR
jgi:hypothetical protein